MAGGGRLPVHLHQQVDQEVVGALLGGEESRAGGVARLAEAVPLDRREGLLHEPAGRFEVAAAAQHPGLSLQSPGQIGRIGERPEQPEGAVEMVERGRVVAGGGLQPAQIAEAAGLLAGIAEAAEDRQGLRVGPAGVVQPAELAVGHAERGQRDGPAAGPGRAQRQGALERLQGRAGPSRVLGEEPQGIQGGGLVVAVLRLAEERERGARTARGPGPPLPDRGGDGRG